MAPLQARRCKLRQDAAGSAASAKISNFAASFQRDQARYELQLSCSASAWRDRRPSEASAGGRRVHKANLGRVPPRAKVHGGSAGSLLEIVEGGYTKSLRGLVVSRDFSFLSSSQVPYRQNQGTDDFVRLNPCRQITPEQHRSFQERSSKGQYFVFPIGRLGKGPGAVEDAVEGDGEGDGERAKAGGKGEASNTSAEGSGSGFMVLLSQAQDGKHVLLTWLEEFRLDPSKAPSYMTVTVYPELEESKGVGASVVLSCPPPNPPPHCSL